MKKNMIISLMALFVFGCQSNSVPKEEEEDFTGFYEAALEKVESKNQQFYQELSEREDELRKEILGYWILYANDGTTREMLIDDDEICYVVDNTLVYRGPYSFDPFESCPLRFADWNETVYYLDNQGQGSFCTEQGPSNEREWYTKDNTVASISWNCTRRCQTQNTQPQQQNNNSPIGVFRNKSDVFKYLETYSFRDSKGFGIRISSPGSVWFSGLSSGDEISCGFSTTEVTVYSENVAFLKNRDYNGEGWEATVNSEKGTIEFAWAGLRDHSYRNAIPSYDIFRKK